MHHGLVRNQPPWEVLRYADVLAARVREWMPAMHYGGRTATQPEEDGHRYLRPKPTVGIRKWYGCPNYNIGVDQCIRVVSNYYLVKALRSTPDGFLMRRCTVSKLRREFFSSRTMAPWLTTSTCILQWRTT